MSAPSGVTPENAAANAGGSGGLDLPPVRLLTHSGEGTALGGPSVRVPRTAAALRAMGVTATAGNFHTVDDCPEDVVHLFNLWPPHDALRALRQLKAAGKTVIFSPIYLDLSLHGFWAGRLPHMSLKDRDAIVSETRAARAHIAGRGRLHEVVPGLNGMMREMLRLADHVVFLSQAERAALARLGAVVPEDRCSLIVNPVDAARWQGGTPDQFRAEHLPQDGPQDYVISVGRIEPRKNQLLLARAMRGMDLRLVVVGQGADTAYGKRLIEEAGDQLILPGRFQPESDMLRSALSGARAFALPSWAEGASLAALEAAAAGAPLVLGDLAAERDYFGDLAQYCDPGDPDAIRAALETAMAQGAPTDEVRQTFADTHSWARHARATAEAYAAALDTPDNSAVQASVAPSGIVLDVTALTHPRRATSGAHRAIARLTHALMAQAPDVICIAWHGPTQQFFEVPARYVHADRGADLRAALDGIAALPPVSVPQNAVVLVMGENWADDHGYLPALETIADQQGCRIVPVLHSLEGLRRPHMSAPDTAGRYSALAARLVRMADRVVTHSDAAAQAILTAAAPYAIELPDIRTIEFGDLAPEPGDLSDDFGAGLVDMPFVLAPCALHPWHNPDLLRRVWARFAEEEIWQDVQLVVAGEVTPEGLPILDRIARDTRVNGRIHVLNGTSASELAWLYERCLFVVDPGHRPGWVPATLEGAAFGKPCLVSQTADPAAPDALDAEDFRAWRDAIAAWLETPPARNAAATDRQAPLWADTAQALTRAVMAPYPAKRGRSLLSGEAAQTKQAAPPLMLRFGAGWDRAGQTCRRMQAPMADLFLRADGVGTRRPLLLLEFPADLPPRRLTALRVMAGQNPLFSMPPGEGAVPKQVLTAVPENALSQGGDLHLTLHAPAFSSDDPETDMRMGLVAATLIDPATTNPLYYLHDSFAWSDGSERLHVDLARPGHRDVVARGLVSASAWGVGGARGAFQCSVPVLATDQAQRLTLLVRPIATPTAPVSVCIRVNGQILGRETFEDDTPTRMRMTVAPDLLARHAPVIVSIETDSFALPSDLNIGTNTPLAGIGLTDILLTPEESK